MKIVCILVPLFLATSAQAQPCLPAPADLVSWWDGDRIVAGTAIDLRGPNDGPLLNGLAVAPGVVGNAFFHDGVDDAVEVPDHPSLSFGDGLADSPFSIEGWIRRAALNTDDVIAAKYNTFVSPFRQEYILQIQKDNALRFRVVDSPNDFRIEVSTDSVIDLNWHHVAATYTATGTAEGLRLFIDGVQQPVDVEVENPAYVAMEDTESTFLIGATRNTAGPGLHQVFNGWIDELSLYSRALSALEIMAIFDAGPAGKCKAFFSDGFESGDTSAWTETVP